MNFNQLKAFLLLSNGATVTETAKIMYCTQPSISIKIKKLEDELNTHLFERINNRLYLTPQGKLYKQYASQILNIVEVSSKHIKTFDDPSVGEIKIGASHFIGVYILPKAISLFKKKYPLVQISISIGKTQQLIRSLQEKDFDFIVIADDAYVDSDEHINSIFLIDPLVLICSPENHLSQKKSCTISEIINDFFLIKPKNSAISRFIHDRLINNTVYKSFTNYMIIDSTEAIKQGVIHNLGIAIVQNACVEHEVNTGLISRLTIDGLNLERGIQYVHHKNKYLLPAVYNFFSFLNSINKW